MSRTDDDMVRPTPSLVDGSGIQVGDRRWVTDRTLEVDLTSASVDRRAMFGPHRIRITFPAAFDRKGWVAGGRLAGGQHHPLVLLLHGGGGGRMTDWTESGGLEAATASTRLIAASVEGGKVGWYTDWVGGGPAQRWRHHHLDELVPWIDANLPTIPDRTGRAVAGLSMGGFGAVHYAQVRPHLFGFVASFSGAVHLGDPRVRATIVEQSLQHVGRPFGAFGLPIPPADGGFRAADPVRQVERLRDVAVALYTGPGLNRYDVLEGAMDACTTRLHDALDAAGIEHHLDRYPCGDRGRSGGHDFTSWKVDLVDAIDRMVEVLDGARDRGTPLGGR